MSLIDGLMALYHLNSNWLDSSGNELTAVPSGATFELSGARLGSACASFDGVDDYLTLGDSDSFQSSAGTWAFWLKHNGMSTSYEGIVVFGAAGWNNNITISTYSHGEGNALEVKAKGTNPDPWPYRWTGVTPTGVVLPNVWNHVALVHDGVRPYIYVNGELVLTVSAGADLTVWTSYSAYDSMSFYICANAGNGKFSCLVDEFGVWDRALTTVELSELVNNGSGMEVGVSGPGEGVPGVVIGGDSGINTPKVVTR